MNIKAIFIRHSCFTLEFDEFIILFDYFKGDVKLASGKRVYALCSHSHPDHYSSKVFDAAKGGFFIFSKDIKAKTDRNTHYMGADESFETPDFTVYTYGSTDEGVSFVVEVSGKTIFFAGDLNDWYWEMEDDEHQRKTMHGMFRKELAKIAQKRIDIAFFPVDPRQQGQWDLGAAQVLESLKPKYFFPMHFWGDYKITDRLKDKYGAKYPDTEFITISEKNQSFELQV